MSRSVPRTIDRRGEYLSACDQCGVPFLRSALRRCRDGLLRCPDDFPGRDEVTLAEITASRAAAISRRLGAQPAADGAKPDVGSDGNNSSASSYTGPISRRTAEDVYNNDVHEYLDGDTPVGLPGF